MNPLSRKPGSAPISLYCTKRYLSGSYVYTVNALHGVDKLNYRSISSLLTQPTFCFDKDERMSKVEYFDNLILNVFVFAGASEYLRSVDKWLLHINCIFFYKYFTRAICIEETKLFSTDSVHKNSKFALKCITP